MKLTKKELQKIADMYCLGKIKKFSLIDNGLVNYNFFIKTDAGKFIARVLGKSVNKGYLQRKVTEIKVLNYLGKESIPYITPKLIKNNLNEFITSFRKSAIYVYHYINGNQVKKLNNVKIKEIAKGLALYHKVISKIPIKTDKKSVSDLSWLVRKYGLMKKVKPKNRLDRLMKQNFNIFDTQLRKSIVIRYKEKPILIHGDFQQGNLLFSGDKLVAILDFDNVDWSWKVKDIAICIKRVCLSDGYLNQRKINLVTEEYRKHYPLSKNDIAMIKPMILHNYCIVFWWAYNGQMKDAKNRYSILDRVITEMKNLLEETKDD